MPRLINENGYILQTEETSSSGSSSTAALLSAVKTPSVTLNPGTDISEAHFTSLGLAYDISDHTVKCLQMSADGKLLCDVGNLTLNTGSLTVDNTGVETGLATVNTTLQGNLKMINGTDVNGDIPLTVTDSSLTGALNVTPVVASENFTRNAIFASDGTNARIVECDTSGKLQVGVTGSVTATLSTTDYDAINAITTAVSVGNVVTGTNAVSSKLGHDVAHTKTVVVGVDSNNEGTPIKVDTDGKLYTKSDLQFNTSAVTAINTLIDRTVMVGHYPVNNTGVPLKVDGTGILQIAGTVELGTTDNTVLGTIAGDTTSLDDKITTGADSTLTEAQQTVIYGQDSVTPTTLRALKTDTSGNLQVNTATDVTVNGTVTANLSAVDNAVLDSIDSKLTSISISYASSAGQAIMINSISQIEVDTSSLDTKITNGANETLAGAQQTVIYGQDSAAPTTLRALKTDTSGNLQVDVVSGAVTTTLSTNDYDAIDDINDSIQIGVDTGITPSTATSIVGKIAGNVSHQRSVMIGVDNSDTAAPEGVPLSVDGDGVLNVATDFTSGNQSELTESKQVAVYGLKNGGGGVRMLELDGSGRLKISNSASTGPINDTPAYTSNFTRQAIFASDGSTAMVVKCSSAGKLEVDANITAGNITGFNLESTQTAMSAKLPLTLSGSGNLKVSIEEGATPAITGFSTAALQGGGLPAALDSGNLKVAIQSGATPAITGFNLESTQSAMSGKISKGANETIDAATGAQQVLIYGIDGDDNLRGIQLDNSGRIKTNTNEGVISSTAAIGTTFARTALFASDGTHARVVNCDVSGNLQVDITDALPTGTNKIGSVGLVANTAQDGTGTEKNIICDSDGKLLVAIPDEDYEQYPTIVTTVPSTDTITSVPVVNIPRYFTYSTLFSAITEAHSQSYDNNTIGFTSTIVTTGFTKISVVGKITNTFSDELSNVLRVELWPVFSSSPSEDDADNMIGPVASGLFIKDYLYFDTVELLYPSVKLRVVNEGISDAVLNLRVYMRK